MTPPHTSNSSARHIEAYARAFEAGALAALEWIADEYPALNEPSDDYPSPTEAAAEYIGRVIDLMRERGLV